MFEYNEAKLELNIKGTKYEIREPSAQEQEEISGEFKDVSESGKSAVQIYTDFFEKLGLKKDVTMGMSMNGLLALFAYVVGSKKN